MISEDNLKIIKGTWGKLLEEWKSLPDGDGFKTDDELLIWTKSNEILTCFISQEENHFDLTIHSNVNIADDLLFEFNLTATNFEQAAKEADKVIAEYILAAADIFKQDNEVRIVQAFAMGREVMGVGADGKLYKFIDKQGWRAETMHMVPESDVEVTSR